MIGETDQIFLTLFWFALACLAVILIDGWFLRPRRDPASSGAQEPAYARVAGYALVGLGAAMLWRLFRYEAVDFSLMLLVIGVAAGGIWLIDAALFARKRARLASDAGASADGTREPIAVEYARSFFPVIFLVLVIRSFVFEPFRIPSDSMMPTLFDGDFIFVSKYAYGLRLPVFNSLIVPTGTPERGDVIVFRLPPNPKINYIKRLVGLPGDHIQVDERNRVFVNGKLMVQRADGIYRGPKEDMWIYSGAPMAFEHLGTIDHRVLFAGNPVKTGEWTVPAGHYFFMGDNRNNSQDSRFDDPSAPGFVPAQNLVGKAVRIWLNLDTRDGPLWRRIGNAIQ